MKIFTNAIRSLDDCLAKVIPFGVTSKIKDHKKRPNNKLIDSILTKAAEQIVVICIKSLFKLIKYCAILLLLKGYPLQTMQTNEINKPAIQLVYLFIV